MKQPLKFLPYFRNTMWGGKEIARFKQISVNCRNIGESWELSAVPGYESIVSEGVDMGLTLTDLTAKYGEALMGHRLYQRYGDRFPLTIRLIDAKEDLPVGVLQDPSPESNTTVEDKDIRIWHILSASPGAMIRISPADLCDGYMVNANGNTITADANGCLESCAGDSFYMPYRYVKTIGAGNFLIEIRQSCDSPTLGIEDIHVHNENINGTRVFSNPEESLTSLVCTKGAGTLRISNVQTSVCQGETILIPAATDKFEIEGDLSLLQVAI